MEGDKIGVWTVGEVVKRGTNRAFIHICVCECGYKREYNRTALKTARDNKQKGFYACKHKFKVLMPKKNLYDTLLYGKLA